LFRDLVSMCKDCSDFRLGADQLNGLRRILDDCSSALVYVPAEFAYAQERGALVDLPRSRGMMTVDRGQTHYIELADGAVSWRFKPLARNLPIALTVSPPDRRVDGQLGSSLNEGKW